MVNAHLRSDARVVFVGVVKYITTKKGKITAKRCVN